MKRYLAIACAGLLLAACAGSKITPAKSELLGCEAYTTALAQLAPLRADGKLNAATVDVVEHVRATLNPLCLGPAPDVNASVKDVTVDAGTRALNEILAVVF